MSLSNESIAIIRSAAKEAGDHLKDRLPPCEFLPKRNSYAHVWERVKHHFGKSYRECDDSQVNEILIIIEHCRNNPC